MQISYQPNIGTLLHLDTLRRVADTAQCVNFALNGDIEGLKHLFTHGLASPRDVSTTRGYSVLRWALYGKQYKTCEFLIFAGADPDYKPISAIDNSPRKKACHFLLEGGLSDEASSALQILTRGGHLEDFVDEVKFTQTHKIVLGLSLQCLEDEIILHPEDIDEADAMGRTALAWAAARGVSRAVVTLLRHGADPNTIDIQLSGPVSNAAARGHTLCPCEKGSPLNCAARGATDALLLKSLLDFGADVDSSGLDGKTALIHAARIDNASFAMLLLEYGADINAASTSGSTPVTTAITYNSHNVLRLILDRWHEYFDYPRLKGPHLLQVVAQYADATTLKILAATDHLRLKYDQNYTIADFGSRLHKRPDLTEELSSAFNDLLSIINQMPDLRGDSESLLEAGFFSCSSSRVNSNLKDFGEENNIGCRQISSCLGAHANPSAPRFREEAGVDSNWDDDFENVPEVPLLATDASHARSAKAAK